jgi:hypothetical protein
MFRCGWQPLGRLLTLRSVICITAQRLSTNIQRALQYSANTAPSPSAAASSKASYARTGKPGELEAPLLVASPDDAFGVMHDLQATEAKWRLKKAAHPDEILWYNLQYSHRDQAKWSVVTMSIVWHHGRVIARAQPS